MIQATTVLTGNAGARVFSVATASSSSASRWPAARIRRAIHMNGRQELMTNVSASVAASQISDSAPSGEADAMAQAWPESIAAANEFASAAARAADQGLGDDGEWPAASSSKTAG
jgi:hypothetical protein